MSERPSKRFSLPLLWDGFMVYLAIVNLLWIVFDFSYLWFRPFYLDHVPWVVRHYDRVKGIEPHPFTERYLALVDETRSLLDEGAAPAIVRASLQELTRQSLAMLDEDRFPQAPRGNALGAIRQWVVTEAGLDPVSAVEPETVRRAFRGYWAYEPQRLPQRILVFDEKIRPVMRANYFRAYAPDGDDHLDLAWLIDLPFLCLFAAEFLVRWALAVRRHTYRTWYLFPAFHWFDLLGLVPYFRLFRLFRIVSIYLRLHRSDMTSIGQDVVSRSVRFVARAIAEEITDMVTMRILDQTQDRLRRGVYAEILQDEIPELRVALRDGLVETLRQVARDDALRGKAKEFLRLNLDQAVDSAPALRGVPLPDPVLRRLVRGVGEAMFDSLVRTVADTIDDARGREAFEELVDDVIAAAMRDLDRGNVERLIEQVALEMLERTKRAVAVHEWTGEQAQ